MLHNSEECDLRQLLVGFLDGNEAEPTELIKHRRLFYPPKYS